MVVVHYTFFFFFSFLKDQTVIVIEIRQYADVDTSKQHFRIVILYKTWQYKHFIIQITNIRNNENFNTK